jgi:hypothetical protein
MGLINRTDFRLLRYFSTVLTPNLDSGLETHPPGSNSRGCEHYISLRTVAEKSLMLLKSVLFIARFRKVRDCYDIGGL